MNDALCVRSTTLRQAAGGKPRFPAELRAALVAAVRVIRIADLLDLLARHEADAANFDSRIEENLRDAGPDLAMHRHCRVSPRAKFNHDLVIEAPAGVACIEIEKGNMARFEFDILKMQASAGERRRGKRPPRVWGCFIVPMDNVVAAHITGNSRESSYAYLVRLSRLLVGIRSMPLDDILLVGYGVSGPVEVLWRRRSPKRRAPHASEVIAQEKGLLGDAVVKEKLPQYPLTFVTTFRRRLLAQVPTLREKLNPNLRYLGYGLRGRADAMYVYFQRGGLVIDIRLAADRAAEVRSLGFQVRPRDNYQGRAGWLTGLRVPYNTDKIGLLIELAREALGGM